MLKRIGFIAVLTGIGQFISLIAIKLSSNYLPLKDVASIAQIDSLIVFTASILAAGLQSAAMRDIATEQNWQLLYKQNQSARFSLSILLCCAGFLCFLKWEYAVFFLSPLIALNGDYALYALGQSVKGAVIACIRMLIPYALLIAGVFWAADLTSHLFFFAWLISYLFTNRIIASILQINMVVKPVLKNLNLYIQSFPLGIAIIFSNFLGIGLVLIIPFFYPDFIETIAFIGLKFYTIFKGVLRIIHQAFLKEMIENKMCLKVDQISILLAVCYLGSFAFFPRSFILNFFGEPYVAGADFFLLLGVSAIFYAFLPSSAIKALFEKKDISYAFVVSIAALVVILGVCVLPIFNVSVLNIGVSVIIGEMFMLLGLVFISSDRNLLLPRLLFLLKTIPLLIIPLVFRIFLGDVFIWYLISFTVVSVIMFILNYRDFKDLQ